MSLILKVKDLRITFPVGGQEIAAVDGISFSLRQGRVLGLVGESGCGKTLSALSLLRLIDRPGKISGGEALYYGNVPELMGLNSSPTPALEKSDTHPLAGSESTPKVDLTASVFGWQEKEPEGGIDLFKLNENEMRKIRGHKIAMIFQEPMTSLNPVFTVGSQIMEAILLHQRVNKSQAKEIAIEMLRKVRIPDPEKRIHDYPHQMSGGMRQRVMIAMALSCQPDILIADEPTTALDVTIQAQILELIRELIEEMHMSVLLITHDLGVVAQICDDVMVMYAGNVVEKAPVKRLFSMPKHPYTVGLLESIPKLFLDHEPRLSTIGGTVPPLGSWPQGCRFSDRCPLVVPGCRVKLPSFRYFGEKQEARCLNT